MAENKHRFDIENGKQIALLVAPVLGFVLAAVAVAARWYTRSVRRVNTITEDALCLAALVSLTQSQRRGSMRLTLPGYELCRSDISLHLGLLVRRGHDKRPDQKRSYQGLRGHQKILAKGKLEAEIAHWMEIKGSRYPRCNLHSISAGRHPSQPYSLPLSGSTYDYTRANRSRGQHVTLRWL
jgi:hypothetical protein